MIQILNFGEIIYRTKKEFGNDAKLRVIRSVTQLGFRIISVSDNLVYEAAELKGSYAISYVMYFAGYGVARKRRGSNRRS